jgi:hypothetical protein
LDGFEDGGIGTFGKLRQRVSEVAAIGRRHHDVTARPNECRGLGQKFIRMRDVLDDFGDEDRVE